MPKKPTDVDYKLLKGFSRNTFLYMNTVGCQKFVQYIRILCPGRFISVESVCLNGSRTTIIFARRFVVKIFRVCETDGQGERDSARSLRACRSSLFCF